MKTSQIVAIPIFTALLMVSTAALGSNYQYEEDQYTDIRTKRNHTISSQTSWNGPVGWGLMYTNHLNPHFALEGGVGLSATGFKTALNARYTIMTSGFSPYLAGGFSYGAGVDGVTGTGRNFMGDEVSFKYNVEGSSFLNLMAGVEWLTGVGINLGVFTGYSILLNDNITITEGILSNNAMSELKDALGGGMISGGSLGFSF